MALTCISQSFPAITLYVFALVTSTLIGAVIVPTEIGKLSMAPSGIRFSPLMLVIVTLEGRSIVIPWSSMKDLLTTDPEAPESIISVMGIPFTVVEQHRAVVRELS